MMRGARGHVQHPPAGEHRQQLLGQKQRAFEVDGQMGPQRVRTQLAQGADGRERGGVVHQEPKFDISPERSGNGRSPFRRADIGRQWLDPARKPGRQRTQGLCPPPHGQDMQAAPGQFLAQSLADPRAAARHHRLGCSHARRAQLRSPVPRSSSVSAQTTPTAMASSIMP